MKNYKRVLTVAGSDSGGGAGIQADIKSISAMGSFATTAITAITSQNTLGVQGVYALPSEIVVSQVRSVLDDIGTDAVKIGMLGSAEVASGVARVLQEYVEQGKIRNVVLDPVLVATSGDTLSGEQTMRAMIKELFPLCDLLTPNIPEAEKLTGMMFSLDNLPVMAEKLMQMGAKSVLIKGGHAPSHNVVTDHLFYEGKHITFTSSFHDTPNKHGTGCSLSSAIASLLSQDIQLSEAVAKAIEYIGEAILAGSEYKLGEGHGAIKHFYKYW